MEENKQNEQNKDLPDTTDQNGQDPAAEEQGLTRWMNSLPKRSCILMLIAGLYLVYTGYNLCKNVINGVEGGSAGFMVGGIAFIIIGALMALVGGRGLLREDKLKREQEEEERRKEEEERKKNPEPEQKMSIADRAKLAGRLNEEEAALEEGAAEDAVIAAEDVQEVISAEAPADIQAETSPEDAAPEE